MTVGSWANFVEMLVISMKLPIEYEVCYSCNMKRKVADPLQNCFISASYMIASFFTSLLALPDSVIKALENLKCSQGDLDFSF